MTHEDDPMRDALDHIMRVARGSIQPTKRLDWIALRAKYALEGKTWSRDIRDTPNDRVQNLKNQNERLRTRVAELEALVAKGTE